MKANGFDNAAIQLNVVLDPSLVQRLLVLDITFTLLLHDLVDDDLAGLILVLAWRGHARRVDL